jgi:hypothetical protein
MPKILLSFLWLEIEKREGFSTKKLRVVQIIPRANEERQTPLLEKGHPSPNFRKGSILPIFIFWEGHQKGITLPSGWQGFF